MKNIYKVLLGCFIATWLLIFPPTRLIIWYILPLGSGWDDLVFAAIAVVAIIITIIGSTNGVLKSTLKNILDFLKK